MKKLLLSLIIVLISFQLIQSQNLSLSNADGNVPNGTEITTTGVLGTFLVCHMYITNNASTALDIKVKKKYISLISGAEATFCWAGSCWGAGTFVSDDYQTLNAGTTDQTSFTADYDPKGHEGASYVMYTFFDSHNTDDSVCFTAKFVCTTAGLSEHSENITISSAYPNPANKSTFINYSLPSIENQSRVVVHNMMGNEVFVIPVTEKEGSIMIDTYTLPDGIYFYSFILKNKIYYTKKLVVSHK